MKKWILFLMVFTISSSLLLSGGFSVAGEIKLMTKEELKAMLDSPDLVVLDGRGGKDWTASEVKIKGALRADPQKDAEWIDEYDKEKTIVIYCA